MPTSLSKCLTVWQRVALAASLSFACAVAEAAPVSFSGSVADCSNPALIGSGSNAPAPVCDNTADIANNVAVYTFSVPFGGFTDFTFGGFSDIDIDSFFLTPNFLNPNAPSPNALQPYLSVFQGTGISAAFVTSTGLNTSSTVFRPFLAAGTYSLAISNLTNRSIAESTGGTLGQGFVGRGDPALVGSGSYQLTATVPEPDGAWLAAIGAVALLLRRRQRRNAVRSSIEAP